MQPEWKRDLRACAHGEESHLCSILSAAIDAWGATEAANAQKDAAQRAADVQLKMYKTTREDLLPYNEAGQDALGMAMGRLGEFTAGVSLPTLPPQLTQEWLEQTPGYQFALTQGLKGVQNSASARGLGVSGAALKGAAGFATGLADNTYQQRFAEEQALFGNRQQLFADEVANQTNSFNRLFSLAGLGENAAAMTGNAGVAAAQGAAQGYIGAGNAKAAGIMGATNAASGMFRDAGNALMMMYGGF